MRKLSERKSLDLCVIIKLCGDREERITRERAVDVGKYKTLKPLTANPFCEFGA